MARPTPTWVYVMTCREHIKIGIATHVEMRLRGLQGQNPYKVEVYGHRLFESYSIARKIEGALHEEFAEHRGYGEWFELEPEVAMAALCVWEEYQAAPETAPPPPAISKPKRKPTKCPPGVSAGHWAMARILDEVFAPSPLATITKEK